MSSGEELRWFSYGAAEKLKHESEQKDLIQIRYKLTGKIYRLFEQKVQVSHLQLHHYCQPRQNESMQGRGQFEEKNRLTLEPVILELEQLYYADPAGDRNVFCYLHLADANLDELNYHRPDLLERMRRLVNSGFVKIAGGVLDEAFIGPDDESFSAGSIMAYIDKVAVLFGEQAIAPVIWIPERFFEEKTAAIVQRVYDEYGLLKKFPFVSIIVDENVIAHSLPEAWQGNVFTGWLNPAYKDLRVFVSSNHLRAVMPQATPSEINDYFFKLMEKTWQGLTLEKVNWFLAEYEQLINQYDDLRQRADDLNAHTLYELSMELDRFYIEAMEALERVEPLFVYFVDDLEKNGSWTGTFPFAFGDNRHFYGYLAQARNLFNPYQMNRLEARLPVFKEIDEIKPSSYKEFSIVWNNEPEDVERWRCLTLRFLEHRVGNLDELRTYSDEQIVGMGLQRSDIDWYFQFVRQPVSWQRGQLSKYPEIKLNYLLAQMIFREITDGIEDHPLVYYEYLRNSANQRGHWLNIWNKNRASCPNFIGFFGGHSILFFRLHIAMQLAAVLTLKYQQNVSVRKLRFKQEEWTLVKVEDDFRVYDDNGDCVFAFSAKNLHSLVSGFSRHREGYNSLIAEFMKGRTDAESFGLVEKTGGTTSAHPLVIALDLPGLVKQESLAKTYPDGLDRFDQEQSIMSPIPVAWEQFWVLPPGAVTDPCQAYQKLELGDFQWLQSEMYDETIEGRHFLTYVRHGLYRGQPVDVVKKIDTSCLEVTFELWNRSDQPMTVCPTVVYPTSLDWYDGPNYRVEDEPIPQNGDIRHYEQSALEIVDTISNLRLIMACDREDVKYSVTTAYSYQTTDYGVYTVSPQHLMVMLSPQRAINLQPGQGYNLVTKVMNMALTDASPWLVDWDHLPLLLQQEIERYLDVILQGRTFTDYQYTKLIYARFPEIIFWAL